MVGVLTHFQVMKAEKGRAYAVTIVIAAVAALGWVAYLVLQFMPH
jgi:hypothetical protein